MMDDEIDYLAGLVIPIGSSDSKSTLKEDGLWNSAGEKVYEVPTPYMQDKVDRRTQVADMLWNSFEDMDMKVGTYSKEDAVEDGLNWFQRRKITNTLEDLGEVGINSSSKMGKDIGGSTISSPGILWENPTMNIKLNRASKVKGETLSHEFKHAVDILEGREVSKSSYWNKGSEALGRISNNRSHFTNELTSSKSPYGVHPLLEFNPKTGTFGSSNAVIYLRDEYKHGNISKEEGSILIDNLNKERKRLSDLMNTDNRFKSLLYSEAPDKFDKSLQDRKRDIKAKKRVRNLRSPKFYE